MCLSFLSGLRSSCLQGCSWCCCGQLRSVKEGKLNMLKPLLSPKVRVSCPLHVSNMSNIHSHLFILENVTACATETTGYRILDFDFCRSVSYWILWSGLLLRPIWILQRLPCSHSQLWPPSPPQMLTYHLAGPNPGPPAIGQWGGGS